MTRLAPKPAALYWLLRWHEGRPVAMETIRDVLWGGDPAGGPLTADLCIKVYAHRIRTAHPEYEVVNYHSFGYAIKPRRSE